MTCSPYIAKVSGNIVNTTGPAEVQAHDTSGGEPPVEFTVIPLVTDIPPATEFLPVASISLVTTTHTVTSTVASDMFMESSEEDGRNNVFLTNGTLVR